MSMDAIINLEEALGRKFTEQESARLREIGRQLHLRDDDALWSLLAALEYQRIFYEALPDRIADASREIMDGISAAAASRHTNARYHPFAIPFAPSQSYFRSVCPKVRETILTVPAA